MLMGIGFAANVPPHISFAYKQQNKHAMHQPSREKAQKGRDDFISNHPGIHECTLQIIPLLMHVVTNMFHNKNSEKQVNYQNLQE